MTNTTSIPLFDLLLDLISKASTVSDEQKEAWIKELETSGMSPELRDTLEALFIKESEIMNQYVDKNEDLVAYQNQQIVSLEGDLDNNAQELLDEHEESIKVIEREITEKCMAEERGVTKAIEGKKKEGENTEIAAIRASLKQND